MTTEQAATYLHVSTLTIRRWVKEGKLRGERIGWQTLVMKEDIRRIALRSGEGTLPPTLLNYWLRMTLE